MTATSASADALLPSHQCRLEGALKGRVSKRQRSSDVAAAAAAVEFTHKLSIPSLADALRFVKTLEAFRGEVYARHKYAVAKAAHSAGTEANAPQAIPRYDGPFTGMCVNLPGLVIEAATAADAQSGVKLVVDASTGFSAVASGEAPVQEPLTGATTRRQSAKRDFMNQLIKGPAAARMLAAVGLKHMNGFNSKVLADVYADSTLPKVHALPNRGVSLKGDGVNSEVSSRVVAQLTRAFAVRIKKQVEAEALTQAACVVGGASRGTCTETARALVAQAYSRLNAEAAADPAWLLKHAVTKALFEKHLGHEPDVARCPACGDFQCKSCNSDHHADDQRAKAHKKLKKMKKLSRLKGERNGATRA
jgi:hypothetical protein